MKTNQVLALDVAGDILRGVLLIGGSSVGVGAFAQSPREAGQIDTTLVQIALGLDRNANLPIALTGTESLSSQESDLLAPALQRVGFESIALVPHGQASLRANPTESDPVTLHGVEIPHGLLSSHPGLTLSHLAPVVGAGLELLDGERSHSAHPSERAPTGSRIDRVSAATSDVMQPTHAGEVANTESRIDGPSNVRQSSEVATRRAKEQLEARSADAATKQTSGGSKRTSKLPYLVLGALLVGLVGLVVSQRGSDAGELARPTPVPADSAAAEPTAETELSPAPEPDAESTLVAEPTTAAEPSPAPEPDAESTLVAEPSAEAESTLVAEPSAEAEPSPEPEPDADAGAASDDELATIDSDADTTLSEQLSVNEAIYRDGKLYLSGPIQSQERIDYIVGLATPLLGEENVINDYYVDPTETTQSNGAVRIDEPLLFASGSTTLNPELQEVLDLGVIVMQVFPQVTMQVIGHTDDIGPAEQNQALSEARAQSVVDYMIESGVASDRFDAFGLGETEPIADNGTEQGRSENRRIDVALLDLLAEAPSN